jgi:hypothetical protein
MNGTVKVYVAFWVALVVVIASIVIGVTVTALDNNKAMVEMVKAGANALEAGCAVEGSNETGGIDCNILMSKK